MYAAFPESLRGAQAGHRCFAADVPINCMGVLEETLFWGAVVAING